MTKAKVYNLVKAVIALLMIALIVPSVVTRVKNESGNKDVVVSLLYNDIRMKLSASDLDRELRKYREMGVTTMSVQEEDLNSLIASGTVTCLKYNVIKHRFDDESEDLVKQLNMLPNINNDSYVLLTKREQSKDFLRRWIPAKYSDDEYAFCVSNTGADVYVLYEGTPLTWQISVGYKEEELEYIKSLGFDIAFDARIKNYSVLDYLDEYDRLIKKYNVKYFNIRDNSRHPDDETEAEGNYEGISKLIQDNDMTLVVSENWDQLSNEKPIGYKTIFEENSDKVVRSYETYVVQPDDTEYMFRYRQYLNSTIDRNIRFITVTQVVNPDGTYMEQNELTQKALKVYLDKINSIGYNTNSFSLKFDYKVNRPLTSAAALVLMGIMLLTMIEWLFGRTYAPLTILAGAGCVLGAAATFFLPESLLELYPSAFALLAPCFCLTMVFIYADRMVDKLNHPKFIFSTMLLALLSISLCGMIQGGLLSGIDYYINFSIFRGIKISLYAPLLYSMVAYYMIFVKKMNLDILQDVRKFFVSQVRVYWIVLVGVFALVGMIYIRRSGNVNTISGMESLIRNFITENFPARPRTKEFVAWPCLMLFAYYLKARRVPLASFVFSIGGSIVFASIINSFCHVFTDLSTIFTRVAMGAFLSIFICIFVYIVNRYFLKLVDWVIAFEKRLSTNEE